MSAVFTNILFQKKQIPTRIIIDPDLDTARHICIMSSRSAEDEGASSYISDRQYLIVHGVLQAHILGCSSENGRPRSTLCGSQSDVALSDIRKISTLTLMSET